MRCIFFIFISFKQIERVSTQTSWVHISCKYTLHDDVSISCGRPAVGHDIATFKKNLIEFRPISGEMWKKINISIDSVSACVILTFHLLVEICSSVTTSKNVICPTLEKCFFILFHVVDKLCPTYGYGSVEYTYFYYNT